MHFFVNYDDIYVNIFMLTLSTTGVFYFIIFNFLSTSCVFFGHHPLNIDFASYPSQHPRLVNFIYPCSFLYNLTIQFPYFPAFSSPLRMDSSYCRQEASSQNHQHSGTYRFILSAKKQSCCAQKNQKICNAIQCTHRQHSPFNFPHGHRCT